MLPQRKLQKLLPKHKQLLLNTSFKQTTGKAYRKVRLILLPPLSLSPFASPPCPNSMDCHAVSKQKIILSQMKNHSQPNDFSFSAKRFSILRIKIQNSLSTIYETSFLPWTILHRHERRAAPQKELPPHIAAYTSYFTNIFLPFRIYTPFVIRSTRIPCRL